MTSFRSFLNLRLFIYMVMVLVGFCSVSVLLFKIGEARQTTLQSIKQEHIVINDVASLLSFSDEMIMSNRGFYIVKENESLVEFQKARSSLLTQNKKLHNYAGQSKLPVSFANRINLLVNEGIRISDSIINQVNTGKESDAKTYFYISDATRYNKEIRRIVQEFIDERLKFIDKIEQKAAEKNQIYVMLFGTNIILLFLVVIIGAGYINKSFRAKSKAEKMLQSYKQSIRFLNSLSEGLVVQDNKGFILECNTAAETILGLNADQIHGKSSLDPSWRTIHEDGSNFPGRFHPAMQVLETGLSYNNIIMGVYKPSGELTWISVNSHPVSVSKDGTVLSVVSSFTDITKQKAATEKLLQNEERLRLAIEKTGDNTWEHNFETGITWFSAANNHFLGYTAEELSDAGNQEKWWGSIHADDKHLLRKNDKEYKSGKRDSHSLEYRISHKNGSVKWVLDRGVVIERAENGLPVRVIGTHTDITNEKQQQELLIQKEKDKRREVVEAVIQAQEKEREEIAFELHEVIAQSLSSLNILLELEKRSNPSIEPKLKLFQNTLTEVINELRLISQSINTSTLKLMGLESTIEDIIRSSEKQSSIKFVLDTSHFNSDQVIDFPVQVAFLRILQEVLKNIICHSGATTAHVELHSSKNLIQLFTRDNGKGFNQNENGYGLGLKTVISRAEQYGGNVEIVSSPGKGCLLQIILPSTINEEVSKFIMA